MEGDVKNKQTNDMIDGVTEDIPNHFGNIYKELYNSVKDGKDVQTISDEVKKKKKEKKHVKVLMMTTR